MTELKLNLGCGNEKLSGWTGIDIVNAPNVDIVAPIEKLPFKDSSATSARAWNVLEHVPDLNKVLHEVWRVLKPNGEFIISVPHWSGWLAHYEEHVRSFNLYSFIDYTKKKRMTSRYGEIAFEIKKRKIIWDKHGIFVYRYLFEWIFNLHPQLQNLYEQTFLAYLFPAIEIHFTLQAIKKE